MVRRIIGIARGEWTRMTRHRLFYMILALAVILPLLYPLLHGFQERLAAIEQWGASDLGMPGQVALCRAVSFALTILIPLLLIYAAMSVTSETEHRTLKTLLVRPVWRREFLFGKLVMLWLFAAVILVILFITAFAMSGIFFDWPELFRGTILDPEHVAMKSASLRLRLTVMFPLILLATLAYVTVAFSISTIAKRSGTSVGITMIFFIFGALILALDLVDDSSIPARIILNAHCSNPLIWALDAAEGFLNITIRADHYLFAIFVPAACIVLFGAASGIIFSRRRIATS